MVRVRGVVVLLGALALAGGIGPSSRGVRANDTEATTADRGEQPRALLPPGCEAQWDNYQNELKDEPLGIERPGEGETAAPGARVDCIATELHDADHRYDPDVPVGERNDSWHLDTVHYQWSAVWTNTGRPAGSWKGAVSTGRVVTWIAPADEGEVTIRLRTYDEAALPADECGSRDDEDPLIKEVRLAVSRGVTPSDLAIVSADPPHFVMLGERLRDQSHTFFPSPLSIAYENADQAHPVTVTVTYRPTWAPTRIVKTITQHADASPVVIRWDGSIDPGGVDTFKYGAYVTFDVRLSQPGHPPVYYRSGQLYLRAEGAKYDTNEVDMVKVGEGSVVTLRYWYELSEAPRPNSVVIYAYQHFQRLARYPETGGLSMQSIPRRSEPLALRVKVPTREQPFVRLLIVGYDNHADEYQDKRAKPMLVWD